MQLCTANGMVHFVDDSAVLFKLDSLDNKVKASNVLAKMGSVLTVVALGLTANFDTAVNTAAWGFSMAEGTPSCTFNTSKYARISCALCPWCSNGRCAVHWWFVAPYEQSRAEHPLLDPQASGRRYFGRRSLNYRQGNRHFFKLWETCTLVTGQTYITVFRSQTLENMPQIFLDLPWASLQLRFPSFSLGRPLKMEIP